MQRASHLIATQELLLELRDPAIALLDLRLERWVLDSSDIRPLVDEGRRWCSSSSGFQSCLTPWSPVEKGA